jgi:AAA domain
MYCNNKIPEIVVEYCLEDEDDAWVDVEQGQPSSQFNTSNSVAEIPEWKVLDIVKLLLRKTTARSRPTVFKSNLEATVCEANGSMESILQWGRTAQLDPRQKRAFESIISSFLLTFHDFQQDDYNDSTLTQGSCDHALRTKDQLLFLKGGEGTQLIMMLHGMGGSGKSTVIALVMAYAQEYCENLQHPFTIRTIVVTALSGVAATLIHGGTTHMAMGLNKRTITSEMMEAWKDTRLVIIDECSFASFDLFTKIEQHARALKPTQGKGYFFWWFEYCLCWRFLSA